MPGDTVTLTLSLGELLVPTVRGLDEDAAQDALIDKQLEFGSSEGRWSETAAPGTVLGSDPKAGVEVEPGTTVDLVVSKGKRPIPVGHWEGEPRDEAVAALEERGLVGEVVEERYDDTVEAGRVISQSPSSGTLTKGQSVQLVVSRGPALVKVPNVYLFGIKDAEKAMQEAGFETRVEDAPGGFGLGYVTRSDPGFDSEAPRGSTITLYVV